MIASTENLASWHNIASLVLGWQPFSLTNVSDRGFAIGNPLAVFRGKEPEAGVPFRGHLRVFAFRGLGEVFAAHGFRIGTIRGAGYFPFPLGVARLDPAHAVFLTVRAQRPTDP